MLWAILPRDEAVCPLFSFSKFLITLPGIVAWLWKKYSKKLNFSLFYETKTNSLSFATYIYVLANKCISPMTFVLRNMSLLCSFINLWNLTNQIQHFMNTIDRLSTPLPDKHFLNLGLLIIRFFWCIRRLNGFCTKQIKKKINRIILIQIYYNYPKNNLYFAVFYPLKHGFLML